MIVLWILLGLVGLMLLALLAAVARTLMIPNRQSTYVPAPDPDPKPKPVPKTADVLLAVEPLATLLGGMGALGAGAGLTARKRRRS